VHDVSSTGLTAYVEPAACVDMNNDLRTLEAEERREIVRLLTSATDVVRRHRAVLATNADTLATVDVLVATARVANRLDARVPADGKAGVIDLRGARNPELMLRTGRTGIETKGRSFRSTSGSGTIRGSW
jgi:DNA mismatch repair protein MutS2